jgi:IS5 family transposase
MLRLAGRQVESLFDQLLPMEVRELPQDLAALDRLLADRLLLAPIERAWEQTARDHGRPTIPMASFVRLMVIKQRTGWGYETLVREVSDSLHLRRFCLLGLTERVPDESTVRKLVRRLGPEVVAELTRVVIGKARRETRFAARAVRIDATVVEADIRYPTDAMLAWQGVRALAREGRRLGGRLRGATVRVVDRSRQIGKTARSVRASSASPTSSATSPRSPRSPPTPAAAPVAMSCRRLPRRAIRARTGCSTRPPLSWTGSAFDRVRSRWTAASSLARPSRPWLGLHPRGRSSPDAPSPAPDAPASGWPATEPAAKGASATSNAATGCGAAA